MIAARDVISSLYVSRIGVHAIGMNPPWSRSLIQVEFPKLASHYLGRTWLRAHLR